MDLINKLLKMSALAGSLFTLVMSPVALGAQALKQKTELEQLIIDTKLDQGLTYQEFWLANKHQYSGEIAAEAEKYFLNNPTAKMPKGKIKKSIGSSGQTVESIELSQDGKSYTFQYIGESNKFLKFNNVILSESDVALVMPAVQRIAASDIKIRTQLNDAIIVSDEAKKDTQLKLKALNKFMGMPEIDQSRWIAMSQKERAEYLINMRGMWNDSLKVLRAVEDNAKKKSSKKTTTSKLEKVIQLMQDEAVAQQFKKTAVSADFLKTTTASRADFSLYDDGQYLNLEFLTGSVTAKSGQTSSPGSSVRAPQKSNCILHGMVSEYVSGSCSESKLLEKYYTKDSDPRVYQAIKSCQEQEPKMMACNPYLYSQASGKSICVQFADKSGKKTEAFQKATHADGPCEKASPLGSATGKLDGTDFLNKDIQGPGRYAESNLKKDVNLAEYAKKQQAENDAFVESYLKGFLGADLKLEKGIGIPDDLLIKMRDIQDVFNRQISFARETCKASANNSSYKQYDKNFWYACDQLQRRHLFIADYLDKKVGCASGGKIDPTNLKCSCPPTIMTVNPGAKCEKIVTNPAQQPAPIESRINCGEMYPEAKNMILKGEACVCDGGVPPRATNSDGESESYTCEKESKFNWKPLLIGAGILGLGILLANLFKNKKHTPNACAAPRQVVNGACMCVISSCTQGQVIYDGKNCQCSDKPTPVVCPGSDPNVPKSYKSIAECPKPTPCWDGSQVYAPAVCPAQNEGGTGTNPSDSSGVPTTK